MSSEQMWGAQVEKISLILKFISPKLDLQTMTTLFKNQIRGIYFYFLIALSLSLWLLQFNNFLTPDGANYIRIGVNIFAGKGITSNPGEPYTAHPPFYAFLIGLFHLLIPDLEFTAHFIPALMFALTVFPLFFIAERIYGRESAHWACLLYMTHGFLLIYSNLIMAEPLFTFLLMTQIFLLQDLILSEERQVKKPLCFGFAAGLCYLTRPEGLLFFGTGMISIFLLARKTWADKMRILFLFTAPFLFLVLPYLVFVHRHTGHWQPSRNSSFQIIVRQMSVAHPQPYIQTKKLLFGLSSDKTRREIDERIDNFRLVDYIKKDNFALIKSGAPSLILRFQELNMYFFAGLGLILVGASFFNAAWASRRTKMEILLILFLVPSFFHIFLIPDPRRYLPIFPILLLWAGHGIHTIRQWAADSFRWSRKKSFRLAAGIVLGLTFSSAGYLYHALNGISLPLEHREMGIWMKENIPGIDHEKVVTEHPFVHFYSGASYAFIPYTASFEDFRTYLRHLPAKYFVISQDFDPIYLESFGFLLDESKALPVGVKRLHTVSGKNKMVLFEIENPNS